MSEIYPNRLYLGGIKDSGYNLEFLTKHKITHIINCAREVPIIYPKNITTYHIRLEDDNIKNSKKLITKSSNILKYLLEDPNKVILVHCFLGISRSVSVIISYLVRYEYHTVNSAIKFIKRKRSFINPFHGYLKEIKLDETRQSKLFRALEPSDEFIFNPLHNNFLILW